MYERVHSCCKVKEKLDHTSPPRRSANLMPYDKIVSSRTHIIIGLPKTGY